MLRTALKILRDPQRVPGESPLSSVSGSPGRDSTAARPSAPHPTPQPADPRLPREAAGLSCSARSRSIPPCKGMRDSRRHRGEGAREFCHALPPPPAGPGMRTSRWPCRSPPQTVRASARRGSSWHRRALFSPPSMTFTPPEERAPPSSTLALQ